jgi:hypothetical protein
LPNGFIEGVLMPDLQRFLVFMAAAFLAFVAVLLFTIRNRASKPSSGKVCGVGIAVVVAGMCFARYIHLIFPKLPWLIYYGIPAINTVFLPPLWLRMSKLEAAQYLPLAWLTAPAIHLLFSLLAGWHDYMPFPAYIPSIRELCSCSIH